MVRSFDAIDQLLWIVAIAHALVVLALCGGFGGGIASIGTTGTHYLVYEGIPCVNAVDPASDRIITHAANEAMPVDFMVKNVQAVALTILRFFRQ